MSVNKVDRNGAFHLAAKSGHIQDIKELVEHRSDGVNGRCLSGRISLSISMWEHISRGLASIA